MSEYLHVERPFLEQLEAQGRMVNALTGESGGRAGEPVRIGLRVLLTQASPSGAEAEY